MPGPQKFFLSCLILGIICNACKKKDPLLPVLDPAAKFEIISPADDYYLPLNGTIKITAVIKGDLTDYSFMDVYLLNANTKDTLHKGNVNKDGTVALNWVSNLKPGSYTIRLVAVNP